MERNKKYYYSHLLNSDERKICDLIIEAIQEIKYSLVLHNYKITNEVFNRIFEVINLDFPELYYFDISKTRMIYVGSVVRIQFGYLYSKGIIFNISKAIGEYLLTLNRKISLECSKLNKEKIIHDYLVKEVEYAKTEIAENKYHNIVGAFLDKTAVCEGYAKAFKYLCELNDILCLVVTGNAINSISKMSEPHSWNIVKLGSYGCCHVDVTWDSCFYHADSSCYTFYNQSDGNMALDHFWDKNKVPRCEAGLDKSMPYCATSMELENLVCKNIKSNVLVFSVKVKKDFSCVQEILELTEKILYKHISLGVKKYAVSYIAERKQIEYKFEKY